MLEFVKGYEDENLIERSLLIQKIKPWDLVYLRGSNGIEYFSTLTNVFDIVGWKARGGTLKSVFDVAR